MILTNSGVLKLMQRIKSFITAQLNTKANSVHTHTISEIDDLSSLQIGGYSKSEVDTLLNGKSDTSHTHTTSDITDFPSLATVATSGSYNDLSNKPTIPTVNNGTLTIQQNGTTVDSFSANSSSDKTVNIQCVDLENNQTVGGIKTFSNAPVVNSISLDGKTIDTDANGDMTYDGNKVLTNANLTFSYDAQTETLTVTY
jgi:hypothetical protein